VKHVLYESEWCLSRFADVEVRVWIMVGDVRRHAYTRLSFAHSAPFICSTTEHFIDIFRQKGKNSISRSHL